MIQVCSRCGTRWNVRDRQRLWCPRCQGALLAPSTGVPASPATSPSAPQHSGPAAPQRRQGPRIPAGYRWIAVRPGSAPPPLRGRRVLGPTPRYATTPRWGLPDPATFRTEQPVEHVKRGPSPGLVRFTLIAAAAIFGCAALIFAIRYGLMIVNRAILLPPLVGDFAKWSGIVLAALAFAAVPTVLVTLTAWLVGRRAAGYTHRGQQDPRSSSSIWLGCLIPFVNLLWAPVFVIEMAVEEGRYSRLRRLIIVWWIVWVLSTAISVFATATSFPDTTQGFADNTLTTTIAYLFAVAVVVLTYRVVMGFVRTPVERVGRRWVVAVGDDASVTRASDEKSAAPVESEGQEPAALAV